MDDTPADRAEARLRAGRVRPSERTYDAAESVPTQLHRVVIKPLPLEQTPTSRAQQEQDPTSRTGNGDLAKAGRIRLASLDFQYVMGAIRAQAPAVSSRASASR